MQCSNIETYDYTDYTDYKPTRRDLARIRDEIEGPGDPEFNKKCWPILEDRSGDGEEIGLSERRSIHASRWHRAIQAWALTPEEARDVRVPPIPYPEWMPHPAAAAWICRQMWRLSGEVSWREKSDPRWRQGWDWGVGEDQLRVIWESARRRTGLRMLALLRHAVKSPGLGRAPWLRRLSDDQMRSALRGCAVAYQQRGLGWGAPVDQRLRAKLGRLPYTAQRLALVGAHERAGFERAARGEQHPLIVRARHCNWALAAEYLRTMRAITDDSRREIVDLSYQVHHLDANEVPPVPEGYGLAVTRQERARLWLGHPVTDIVPNATKREAHEYLRRSGSTNRSFCGWLMDRAQLPNHVTHSVRSLPVARWMIAVWGDPKRRAALERERTITGPHDEVLTVRYIDRIDEIEEADLQSGAKTGVDVAFQAAAERLTEERLEHLRQQHSQLHPDPDWWRPVSCARLLRTPAQLIREQDEMTHCVGTYAGYVARGESTIVALDVLGHRSTVELRPENGRWSVAQHRSHHNGVPHELCERALQACLKHHWKVA